MLASVVIGATAGAVVGKFADHKLKSGLEDKLGAALAAGSAAVIVVLPQSSRLTAEQALPGSPAKSVVEMDSSSLNDLKASLAQAMGKFSPDRTVLPIPDRAFGGTAGRTLTRISAQLVRGKGSADFVAQGAVSPPGHGGVVGECGCAECG